MVIVVEQPKKLSVTVSVIAPPPAVPTGVRKDVFKPQFTAVAAAPLDNVMAIGLPACVAVTVKYCADSNGLVTLMEKVI